MWELLLFCVVATQGRTANEKFEIPVLNMRPSKLAARLVNVPGNFLSPVGIKADDERGLLVATGVKEDVDMMRALINLFDVRPASIKLRIDAVAPIDHLDFSSTFTLQTTKPLVITEGDSGLTLRLSTRLNEDGTVTIYSATSYERLDKSVVARLKLGHAFRYDLVGNQEMLAPAEVDREPGPKFSRTKPRITVTLLGDG
jgi:hypothetical protein